MVDTCQVGLKDQLAQVKEAMTGVFDASSIDYLVLSFTSAGLRWLALRAEMRARICRTLSEDEEAEGYWVEFAQACRFALDTQLWLDSATKPKAYHGKRLDPQAIKEQVDLVSIVERHTRLRKAGRNFVGCCPFHDDRHPSLTVYPERQSWHCFGCNQGGDVISFIMAAENLDFRGALAHLARNQ